MTTGPAQPLDLDAVRAQFPGLRAETGERPLAYLDSASTAQKPRRVIEALHGVYAGTCANVHRGVHRASERATAAFEAARERVRGFIGASAREEVIFTSGTTAALNLVAAAYGDAHVRAGDEVVVSEMEHHSNLVPWQLLCARRGARLVRWAVEEDGRLELAGLERVLSPRTRVVAVTHASNSLGFTNDIAAISRLVRQRDAALVVDGAQAVAHAVVDVQALDCDFYAFSGHKLYGPTGVGVLYGKRERLAATPPWQGGGEMILDVEFSRATYNALPYKLEAGTPNIAGAVGLAAAIDWVEETGIDAIAAHERALLIHARERLEALPGVRLVGPARPAERGRAAPILSLVVDGVHPHDVGTVLDHEGVAVRTGHHCTQPLLRALGLDATVRASLAAYNTREELERLAAGLTRARELFT